MEDDDEFGDLYTDVLQPFASSSALQSLPPPRSEPAAPPIENAATALHSDDVTLPATSSSSLKLSINLNSDPSPDLNRGPSNQTCEASFNLPHQDPPVLETHGFGGVSANLPRDETRSEVSQARVLGRDDFNLNTEPVAVDDEEDRKFDAIDGPVASKGAEFLDKDDNWGVQVDQGDDGPAIPGISIPQLEDSAKNPNVFAQVETSAPGDDSESDSEDDLQIVLNDDHQPHIHYHQVPMAGDGNVGNGDDDDEDEDGDPLVIVSDMDAVHHPPPEEQGLGEDASQAPDGERKEAGEAGKANGGVPLASKIGYGNYGYHPFHSQFKYVRPGATPLPGGPGGPGQVRPPVNVGVGRGRGDWKQAGIKGPSLQKGFHSGAWGNNGRGFGGEFTLPPQKSIFDVDIDSIEEKPWKYPGNDVTDYFNFGLDEDSWKDYCKQLERLRLESTMKNKTHVHVVGSHSEQVYDPDLPPELAAAAAGIQNPSAESYNAQNPDVGQRDISKGTSHMRPPLPTGRPIQVDIGSGERLPSMDTRPPRLRDLDTVIEIVLQDSLDDNSPAVSEAHDPPDDDDASREDIRDDAVEEVDEKIEKVYSDGFPQSLDRRKGDGNVRRLPQPNARHDKTPEEESSSPPEASAEHLPGSKANSPMSPSDKIEASYEERQMKVKEVKRHEISHSTSPCEGEKSVDDKQEESVESVEGNDSHDALSFEERVVSDDETFETEENFQKEKEDVNSSAVVSSGTLDESKGHSMRKLKLNSQLEPVTTKEIDDVGYLKAARSSDNSKATGSSRDHQKGYTVAGEEVIQDEYSSHARDLKRNSGEDGQSRHRKDQDGNMGTEKNTMMAKRREGSHPHRNRDPYSSRSSHVKSEGFDKRRERDYPDGMLQHRDEDPQGRKFGGEDSRKHEHADELIPRHRGKVREGERSNKDEHLPCRKLLENGSWRGHHEKDAGLHYREKDDTLKTRYENMDDPSSKRRKDDEHARRGDHFGKDEVLHRESSRRKRERDESLDQRKRDEQHRRENTDDHRSVRPKHEGWLQRERVERPRERDDRDRSKQSYDDSLSRREREDGRAAVRSGRIVEDKGWIVNERDNSYKDTGRNGDPHKRRERVEDSSSLQVRGSEDAQKDKLGHDEKRSRQEKSTVRSERAVHASDNRRVHERRPKENSRKGKEFERGQPNNSNSSKKPQEERSGRNEMAGVIGRSEKGNAGQGVSDQLHTTREKMEGASSDDEQHGSKRGRSKLERWASHKERDYVANAKPSSSLMFSAGKENNLGAGHSAKVVDEPAKKSQVVDRSRSPTEGKESEVPDVKEGEVKPVENKHLDTVAKLKKRSERFKLPMPSDKDASTIKKLESEPLSSTPGEAPVNSEIKQERPPRKRRWTSN